MWTAETIKAARNQLNLSQRGLCEALGCRQQTVSEWELGFYIPKSAYQKLLSDFFEQKGVWNQVRESEKEWARWLYEHEDAVFSALRMVRDRLPVSQVSKYEKALDAKPTRWK